MPRRKKILPTDLSLADIKRLLAVKENMVALEDRKEELLKELARVEADIAKVARGAAPSRKVVRRKAAKKKRAKKKATP